MNLTTPVKTLALLALLAMPVAARAAESRIPISGPLSIATSGSYVVTRDITAGGAAVLTISAGTVTVDLNGHSLLVSGNTAPVVLVNGATNLTLKNGRLYGGSDGVLANGGSTGSRITLSHVETENGRISGVNLTEPAELSVEDSTLHDAPIGVEVTSTLTSSVLRIARNDMRTVSGVVVSSAPMRGTIEDNVIHCAGGHGISVDGFARGLGILRNDIDGADVGLMLTGNGGGHLVERNVISQSTSTGILITADNCNVLHNTVTACGATGINVQSAGVVIESNVVNANLGFGIGFTATSAQCVYRYNSARGNAAGNYTVGGSGNTDGGGNQ